MRLIRGLAHLESFKRGSVLTIGNFDGLHLGHHAVIAKLAARGAELGLPAVAMVFEPQPLEYFLKDNEPPRLMRLREKAIGFAHLPIDHLLIVRFNRQFANLSAEQFIEDILLAKLNVKHLVVGDDFHFGKARRGNFALLQTYGRKRGFSVENTGSHQTEGLRVSSTLIRDALAVGDLAQAERWLGHPYCVCGRIAHGDKRGRTLGFPTANIRLFRRATPVSGVFAVTLTGIDDRSYPGIANVGTRPTVDGGSTVLLETHLFDFNQNIYGHYVEVQFRQKIREELRFATVELLKEQIRKDISTAQTILSV